MTSYKMTCPCGDTMTVEAATRDEAVAKFKSMMNEAGIKAHMDEKHPGEPLISVADCHRMIEQQVSPV
ncbi:MAG: hypothetical protein Q8R39_01750 [bacterium]|nr:hypothetical protein [bacterium]MDZ4285182.1 hypothetical protein [Patescibacteria group bacterium]